MQPRLRRVLKQAKNIRQCRSTPSSQSISTETRSQCLLKARARRVLQPICLLISAFSSEDKDFKS
eukprot:1081018-Amphidinium_carterae.1